MKRLFIFLIALFVGTFVDAQQIDVPKAVRDAHAGKYASTANFSKIGNLYLAEFSDKGENFVAYYTEEGMWAKTEKVVPFETLKEAIRTEIQNRFLGEGSRYTLDKALVIETPTGGVFESARFKMDGGGTITIYFNMDGTMVKREVVQ